MSAGDATFLYNGWYVAAWDYELLDGRKLPGTILEKPTSRRTT